jgi:hypothetical protein
MNVIAYDIFRCFNVGQIVQYNSVGGKKKKFLFYMLYAFGVPAVISIITVIVEFAVETTDANMTLKPMFGARTCFFDQDSKPAAFIFFYLPLLLIQVSISLNSFLASQLARVFVFWQLLFHLV